MHERFPYILYIESKSLQLHVLITPTLAKQTPLLDGHLCEMVNWCWILCAIFQPFYCI